MSFSVNQIDNLPSSNLLDPHTLLSALTSTNCNFGITCYKGASIKDVPYFCRF